MYINKCTKCGAEFETKNPKRIICPNCLYPDRKPILDNGSQNEGENTPQQEKPQMRSSYSYEGNPSEEQERPYPPRNNYNRPQGDRPNYQRNNYQRPQGGGGYNRNQQGGNRRPQGGGGYNRNQQGGNRRPQGGYNNRPQQGGGNFRRPNNQNRRPSAPRAPRELLVTKEQLIQIETLYKLLLPLPNPDAHEIIGQQIGLEPRKVFFGINLIRQKLFLPKLPYPKRKLAVSADQLMAIKTLYEPMLPLPAIGCHKTIAMMLKMDEWRVHVGIGLIRKELGLDRWNENRADAPAQIIRPRKGLSQADKVAADDARLEQTPKTEEQA